MFFAGRMNYSHWRHTLLHNYAIFIMPFLIPFHMRNSYSIYNSPRIQPKSSIPSPQYNVFLHPAQVLLLARAPLVLRLVFGRIAASDSVVGAEPLTEIFCYEGGQAVARSGRRARPTSEDGEAYTKSSSYSRSSTCSSAAGSNRFLPM